MSQKESMQFPSTDACNLNQSSLSLYMIVSICVLFNKDSIPKDIQRFLILSTICYVYLPLSFKSLIKRIDFLNFILNYILCVWVFYLLVCLCAASVPGGP